MERKGQAAMEFLMTYGWAILAAIIVIGVLAIYFRPSSIAPSSGVISAPLYANAWSITAANISLEIKNNAGETVTLKTSNVTVRDPSGVTCVLYQVNGTNGYAVGAGQLATVAAACSTLHVGDVVNADIVVTYTKGTGTLPLQSTGTISGKVA
jgi:hypothetical protein